MVPLSEHGGTLCSECSMRIQSLNHSTYQHPQLKQRFRFIREMYIDGNIWSVGYFSSTLGLNEEMIKKYIEHQGKRDDPQQISFEFS